MAEDVWKGKATLLTVRDEVSVGDGDVELWKSGDGGDSLWGGEMRTAADPEPDTYRIQLVGDGKRKIASGRVKVTLQRRTGSRVRLLLTGVGFPPF